MFRMILAAALLLALPATHALAEPARGLPETRTQRGFIGIEIPLSGEMQPRVSVGLRRATLAEDGSLRGGELRLVLNPRNLRDAQLRALALKGRVTGALALGGGWDFAGGTAFASVGMVMPRLSGTLDIGGGAVPAMSIGSLMTTGTPASGGSASPAARRRSMARASASASGLGAPSPGNRPLRVLAPCRCRKSTTAARAS